MEENEKKKLHENLKQEIRSLLISSPKTKYGGLTGSILYFDYKQLNCGKEIPYVQLGFHSFLSFLRSMPDVVRIECKPNGTSYRVHPISHHSTEHIQKMVLQQRDKYQYQNRLYNQNWHSNNNLFLVSNNNKHRQSLYLDKSLPRNNRIVNKNDVYNNNNKRTDSKFNRNNFEKSCQDFVLLTPSTSIDDEKICNDQTSSTPHTFRDSPLNLNQTQNQIHINQIESLSKDRSLVSSTISSIEDNQKIVSSKLDDEDNQLYINRLNHAIHHCIEFRYIHRLCRIKFVYRHYPLTDQIKQTKIQLENQAFQQYEQDLLDFHEHFSLNMLLDEQIYQNFFDQYIDLQRNYHYMLKILKKNKNI